MKNHIVHFFATNPDKNEVYSTSNGFLFTENHQATSHANELGDVKVTKHSRDQYAADVEEYLNPKTEPAADEKSKGKGGKGKGAKKDESKKDGEDVKEGEEGKGAEEEEKE